MRSWSLLLRRDEPWNSSLHEKAAMMLSALDRHDDAMNEVSQALRFDPESPRVRQTYATLAARAAGRR